MKLTEHVQIRMTTESLRSLTELAEKEGRPVSGMCREIIKKGLIERVNKGEN